MSKLSETFEDVWRGLVSRGWKAEGGGDRFVSLNQGDWAIKVWVDWNTGVIKTTFTAEPEKEAWMDIPICWTCKHRGSCYMQSVPSPAKCDRYEKGDPDKTARCPHCGQELPPVASKPVSEGIQNKEAP